MPSPFRYSKSGSYRSLISLKTALLKNSPTVGYAEMGPVWRQTRQALEKADEILIIGFSLNDVHFNKWLREADSVRTSPANTVIVDLHPNGTDDSDGPAENLAKLGLRRFEKPTIIQGGIGDFAASL